MKPVIAVPVGAILPVDLSVPTIVEGSFLEKMFANMQEKVAVMVLTTEELIALVEKPHLFGTDVIALVGVPGGRYDAVWSSYVAPLKRLSLETFEGEVAKILANAEAVNDALDKSPHAMRLPTSDDAGLKEEGTFE